MDKYLFKQVSINIDRVLKTQQDRTLSPFPSQPQVSQFPYLFELKTQYCAEFKVTYDPNFRKKIQSEI